MSARFSLDQRLGLEVSPGDTVTAELALAFATLLYFAAGEVDVDPARLTLGDLVRRVQARGGVTHPLRRSSDPRPGGLPLRHPQGCSCAVCGVRRRRGALSQA